MIFEINDSSRNQPAQDNTSRIHEIHLSNG